MATKTEHPEKRQWWINELCSLGMSPERINKLYNTNKIGELTENIKQTLFQEYKTVYSQKNHES